MATRFGSVSRRRVLASVLPALGTATLLGQARLTQSRLNQARRPIPLGGPVFLKTDDPAALAREHRRLGYAAAYCPNAKLDDTPRLKAIEQAFAAEKVILAEVGAWRNLMDRDATKRAANLAYVTERMALAEAVGARCCVDIAGSWNEKEWSGPHPGNMSREFFDATVENVRKILDAVKPKRAKFAIEMMGWVIPDSPDSYLRLLRAVDRPSFAVHLDLCNLINSPDRFYQQEALARECFAKLGRWLVSAHAKDLNWVPSMNVRFDEVIPGRGQVDYRPILQGLAQLPHEVPLMLEHLRTAEEYDEGKRHIQKVGQEIGVAFA